MVKANVLIDNDKVKVTEWSFEVGDSTTVRVKRQEEILDISIIFQ